MNRKSTGNQRKMLDFSGSLVLRVSALWKKKKSDSGHIRLNPEIL
jgi:hypothetical protein